MKNFVYEDRSADLAAMTQQQKAVALAEVGLAAVRFVETQQHRDYVALRFAACRFQTYNNLANEAASLQGGPQ